MGVRLPALPPKSSGDNSLQICTPELWSDWYPEGIHRETVMRQQGQLSKW